MSRIRMGLLVAVLLNPAGLWGLDSPHHPFAFAGDLGASESEPLHHEGEPVRFLKSWGKQGSAPGEFHFPIGIAIDASDQVFVTDHYNNRVQCFDSEGKLLFHFEVLSNPGGIAVDKAGNLFICHFPMSRLHPEKLSKLVSVYTPRGKLLQRWGVSGTGKGELNWPGGIAIHPTNGRVYIADQTNRRMQVFEPDGKFVMSWGEYGTKPGQFGGNVARNSRVGGPQFVTVDPDGNIYTTEASLGRVQKFTAEGKYLHSWGSLENRPGGLGGAFEGFPTKLQGPIGICCDKKGRLWVTAASGRVQQFRATGEFIRGIGFEQGSNPGQFFAPHGIALDSKGCLYVVDAYNHRIQKFQTVE